MAAPGRLSVVLRHGRKRGLLRMKFLGFQYLNINFMARQLSKGQRVEARLTAAEAPLQKSLHWEERAGETRVPAASASRLPPPLAPPPNGRGG